MGDRILFLGGFDVLSLGDAASFRHKIHQRLGGLVQVKVVRISLWQLDAVPL